MNYSVIKYNDIANGKGIRTTLFVSGCRNRCKGCFQPETWDFNYGKEFTIKEQIEIIDSMNEYTNGITLLGGDPIEPENTLALIPFVRKFKNECPNKSIWLYTGYLYENLICKDIYDEFLSYIDVMVDGPFIEEFKDITLKFKGSSNQRIIDVSASTREKHIILYK